MLQSSTLSFLKSLKRNNNKSWFDAHRTAYETARTDFENFIQAVLDEHSKVDPDLKDLVAKKCMFRINRDIRFSKDKTPYKSHFAASMDKGGKKSGLAGYYFHCEPGRNFIAGGLWTPMPPEVKKVRQEIDYCFDEFNQIVASKKFRSVFGDLYTGEGVKLERVPPGFEKDNPAAEYLKFKSWLVTADLSDADITSKGLLKKTIDRMVIMQPFIKFLNRAIEN